MSVQAFLAAVEAHLKSGIATEHTYRPDLRDLFNKLLVPATAINEPKHERYGAPDFVIQLRNTPIGHVEAKDIDVNLEQIIADSEKVQPKTTNGKQLKRYRAALPNLLYTNGLEWHWFVDGEPRLMLPICIGTWNLKAKQLKVSANATQDLTTLLHQFTAHDALTITTPLDLAQRLAQIARWLDEIINQVFATEGVTGSLHRQLRAFQDTLLPNLTSAEFADMYAQTLVYGLFAARVAQPQNQQFSRFTAWHMIPKTNPFLRRMFQEVTAEDLDPNVAWLVDDCARLLAHTDMSVIMADFGKATQQQDPVVHFYETFLQAYDPKLRETRGVYYTPEPVVSYIVRSVDSLLRTHFNKPLGLVDEDTVVLDPATGTGTFLHAIVQQIQVNLIDQGLAGIWNEYVPHSLLPRLFGFELLMAPYTVAHLKLGLLLHELGYEFGGKERLGVYLTNTIADVPTGQMAFAFAQAIAEEGKQANRVKQSETVMVVIGNPPYSGHSANKGKWIDDLLKGQFEGRRVTNYYEVDGAPLGEKNPKWLQDDYVKFIRFGQWRINRTGEGILAFITNNGYLDNPTFRGMRQSLLHEFDWIYILNLHGDSNKKEQTPEGGTDENVFDIQQGVAIGIFVKQRDTSNSNAKVYYADLWGERREKYSTLSNLDIVNTSWIQLNPVAPWYLFIQQNNDLLAEYQQGWKVTEMVEVQSVNLRTHRDALVIDIEKDELSRRIKTVRDTNVSDEWLRANLNLHDNRDWSLRRARTELVQNDEWEAKIRLCHYRPFDSRWIFYDPSLVEYPCLPVVGHFCFPNIGFTTTRQTTTVGYTHILAIQHVTELKCISHDRGGYSFPLYLYPNPGGGTRRTRQTSLLNSETTFTGRRPNLSLTFIADVEKRLRLQFVPDGKGNLEQTWGPEDIFHYAYAIFHSPTYRLRYAEFLKIEFPRLPLTSDKALFAALIAKGAQLVDLHLLRLPGSSGVGGAGGSTILANPGKQGISYPLTGTNIIERVKYYPPLDEAPGYISINSTQRFVGVDPDTWEMKIGGYQPLEKWLKDRKGRKLLPQDVQHYIRMVLALKETQRIMIEIDELIPTWPIT